MKKLIFLFLLLAAVCVAQVPPPKTTAFTRSLIGSDKEAAVLAAGSFQNYIMWEDWAWGTNGCLLPLTTWAAQPAYSWTMPTGGKVFVTGLGVTNLVVTNGMLSVQFTNTVIPYIYVTMAQTNWWKYFIVGFQFQLEKTGDALGQPTNYPSFALHFGQDCYNGSFTKTFHNTVLNLYDRYSGLSALTNGLAGAYWIGGTNIFWDLYAGTRWSYPPVTNTSFTAEIGYVGERGTSPTSDKVLFVNYNGWVDYYDCPYSIWTNSYAVNDKNGTNYTIQFNHAGWIQQYRAWIDKMWVRVPGQSGFSAPSR
jgi:hypothetical protein